MFFVLGSFFAFFFFGGARRGWWQKAGKDLKLVPVLESSYSCFSYGFALSCSAESCHLSPANLISSAVQQVFMLLTASLPGTTITSCLKRLLIPLCSQVHLSVIFMQN